MDREQVARELVKVAKDLTADDLGDLEDGVLEAFGHIKTIMATLGKLEVALRAVDRDIGIIENDYELGSDETVLAEAVKDHLDGWERNAKFARGQLESLSRALYFAKRSV